VGASAEADGSKIGSVSYAAAAELEREALQVEAIGRGGTILRNRGMANAPRPGGPIDCGRPGDGIDR
jgi:hypothetical protein